MNIAFLSNQLDNRGTGNALYNYAHYNEEILGNKSKIYTYLGGGHDLEAYDRFRKRFKWVFPLDSFTRLNKIDADALYHIKSGYDEGFRTNGIPYLVHAVFDNQPHGDRYATISPWMSERFGIPYVPHIVEVADSTLDLREEFEIPKYAVVFGRYGGLDSFDISWVWDAINEYTYRNDNAYFLFMNTDKPDNISNYNAKKIIFTTGTVNPVRKRRFINSCDAMIHARGRGETFGIAIGEFAICGKPIITYLNSHERAHIQELGNFGLYYTDPPTLYEQFDKVMRGPLVTWGYGQYTPELVMKKFNEVFLT